MENPFLLGIGGGTGSGKTTLARAFALRHSRLGAVVIDQDSYYLERDHLSLEERNRINFDEPAALDHALLLRDMESLLRGQAIQKPRYNFATHNRTGDFDRVEPASLIVLDGLFALWDPKLRRHFGLKVFVDADPDVRLIRRIRRDLAERGRGLDSVIEQYVSTVRPMHQLHIAPQRAVADLVLDTTSSPLEDSLSKLDAAVAKARLAFRNAGGAPAPNPRAQNGGTTD